MLTTVGKTKNKVALRHSSPASSILGPVSQDGAGRGVPSSKTTTWTKKSTWPRRAGQGRGVTKQEDPSLVHLFRG